MLHELQKFYLNWEEPQKSCFMALQGIIMDFDEEITEHWKYKLPFFYYKGKPFCYLWYDKKTKEPYIGIYKGILIDHPLLEQGNRKLMKIIRINPCEDIPVEGITEILQELKTLFNSYKTYNTTP